MERKQEAKRGMYTAVASYMSRHAGSYTANAPLITAVADYSTLLADLNEAVQSQDVAVTGITKDKASLRRAMSEAALSIASALRAYAVANNNNGLAMQMKYTPSHFQLGPDTAAMDTALLIHSTASSLASSIAPYQVTAASISALLGRIDTYTAAIAAPRQAIIRRRQATLRIRQLFGEIDTFLRRRLDNLMYFYKSSNPDFFSGYTLARAISNAPSNAQVRSGIITPGQDLPLSFRPFSDIHTVRLHNLGNSPLTFYRSTGSESAQGIAVPPNTKATHHLTDLGTGPLLHVRNPGPMLSKYWVSVRM